MVNPTDSDIREIYYLLWFIDDVVAISKRCRFGCTRGSDRNSGCKAHTMRNAASLSTVI